MALAGAALCIAAVVHSPMIATRAPNLSLTASENWGPSMSRNILNCRQSTWQQRHLVASACKSLVAPGAVVTHRAWCVLEQGQIVNACMCSCINPQGCLCRSARGLPGTCPAPLRHGCRLYQSPLRPCQKPRPPVLNTHLLNTKQLATAWQHARWSGGLTTRTFSKAPSTSAEQ